MKKNILINNEKEVIEKIINNVNIANVVGSYIQLQKYGEYLTGKCPYCGVDKKGMFIVSSQKKIASCFSCNNVGDIINLFAKLEGVKYSEAIKVLKTKYNVEINNPS